MEITEFKKELEKEISRIKEEYNNRLTKIIEDNMTRVKDEIRSSITKNINKMTRYIDNNEIYNYDKYPSDFMIDYQDNRRNDRIIKIDDFFEQFKTKEIKENKQKYIKLNEIIDNIVDLLNKKKEKIIFYLVIDYDIITNYIIITNYSRFLSIYKKKDIVDCNYTYKELDTWIPTDYIDLLNTIYDKQHIVIKKTESYFYTEDKILRILENINTNIINRYTNPIQIDTIIKENIELKELYESYKRDRINLNKEIETFNKKKNKFDKEIKPYMNIVEEYKYLEEQKKDFENKKDLFKQSMLEIMNQNNEPK